MPISTNVYSDTETGITSIWVSNLRFGVNGLKNRLWIK